jgi:hypothetical protein
MERREVRGCDTVEKRAGRHGHIALKVNLHRHTIQIRKLEQNGRHHFELLALGI